MARMLPLRLGRPKLPGHGHAPVATVQRMSTMHDVHASNRTWIVETLAGLDDAGWTSWTLCAGWDVEDLTAHLVARERHQIAAAGIVVPALRPMHERDGPRGRPRP